MDTHAKEDLAPLPPEPLALQRVSVSSQDRDDWKISETSGSLASGAH